MFVIIDLKNTSEKHSTENKSPQTAAFREKPTSECNTIKLYLMIVSSSCSSCSVQGSFYAT